MARAGSLLVLCLAAAAAGRERYEDSFWNVSYARPGLRLLIAAGDPAVLFKGRLPGGLEVEMRVHESDRPLDAPAWRRRVREEWKRRKRIVRDVTEGKDWILLTQTKYGIIAQHHLHVFRVRGLHCFELHVRAMRRSETSEKALRAAVAGLELGPDPGCGLRALQHARVLRKPATDPAVLLRAGIDYAGGGRGTQAVPVLGAALLSRARALDKPDVFEPKDRFALYLYGGRALLAAKRAGAAIDWFEKAASLAGMASDDRGEAAYELAVACATAGRLDAAFAALRRACGSGMYVDKARLSKEKAFRALRADPRWEPFWMECVEGK